jgi:hypothetical protein
MVILPGKRSSWTRNPPDEWNFHWELPAYGPRINQRNSYSAENFQLTGGMRFYQELLDNR